MTIRTFAVSGGCVTIRTFRWLCDYTNFRCIRWLCDYTDYCCIRWLCDYTDYCCIRDGEPWASTSTSTQFLSSVVTLLYLYVLTLRLMHVLFFWVVGVGWWWCHLVLLYVFFCGKSCKTKSEIGKLSKTSSRVAVQLAPALSRTIAFKM